MRSYWKAFGMFLMAAGLLMAGCSSDTSAEPERGAGRASMEVKGRFPAFETRDVLGNTVSSNLFAEKKITVVNIWGTFCPPCIGEMPELGEWARNMPKDAQLIGIICDVENEQDKGTIREAKKILGEAEADFVNLLPNKDLEKYLESVEAVPTTIFVDSQGNIIGDSVIGADVAAYQRVVRDYLNE